MLFFFHSARNDTSASLLVAKDEILVACDHPDAFEPIQFGNVDTCLYLFVFLIGNRRRSLAFPIQLLQHSIALKFI